MSLPNPPQDILLVDDNPNNLQVLTDLLRDCGYQVRVATSGRRGLEAARLAKPDLILLDISMPELDGFAVCRALKEDPALTGVPVIFISARWEGLEKVKAFEVGGADFIQKPIHVQEVLMRVRHQLRLVALQEELRAEHLHLVKATTALQAEINVVKQLLSRLVEPGRAALPSGFHMETLATCRINGDVCAYQAGAPGIHFGMLCDPMGHGLAAGISEIPTMAVFNALAARNLPLPSILAEINRKLHHLLPSGRFSCAILFRMDSHTGDLEVVNAGMPEAVLFRRDGSMEHFPSTYLPLGIQNALEAQPVHRCRLEPGDCFYACSDGLTDLLPEEEIRELFTRGGEAGFSRLLQDRLEARIHDRELSDDVSWCLWPFRPDRIPRHPARESTRSAMALHEGLQIQLSFSSRTCGCHEVGSSLAGLLERHGLPEEMARTLAFLLSEVVREAVDLGEPGRGSGAAAGLGIKLVMHEDAANALARVHVEVGDPGPGSDRRRCGMGLDGRSRGPNGRGLRLLDELAEDLAFDDAGNLVSFDLSVTPVEALPERQGP